MSAKDNPVELPRKLLISHKKSPAEDGEVFLLEHTDGTTESAWNLIAADAGHQDIDSCNLDHLDIHGNYYWGTSGLVESESVIISDYELEIVFNVWTDHHEDDVDCESKWFVTIPQRSLYQFGEWIWECDIELYYSSDILGLVKKTRMTERHLKIFCLQNHSPIHTRYLTNTWSVGEGSIDLKKTSKKEIKEIRIKGILILFVSSFFKRLS
ncbi:hypothetical protein N9236_01385 [bacterium]|nr:hypothetical protein [bacterium]